MGGIFVECSAKTKESVERAIEALIRGSRKKVIEEKEAKEAVEKRGKEKKVLALQKEGKKSRLWRRVFSG